MSSADDRDSDTPAPMSLLNKLKNIAIAVVGFAVMSVVFVPLTFMVVVAIPVGLVCLFSKVVFNVIVNGTSAYDTYVEWSKSNKVD